LLLNTPIYKDNFAISVRSRYPILTIPMKNVKISVYADFLKGE
jgi:hypothetical protein